MWPWRVKMPTPTCWCCNCCWWWSCWRHFVTDLEAEVKKLTFFSNFEHNVWWKFWSWDSDKIWSWSLLRLCWIQVESWSIFWSKVWARFWSLSFMERLMFGSDFEVDAWSRFLRWNLIKICVWTCDINSTLGSVVPLAMFQQRYGNTKAISSSSSEQPVVLMGARYFSPLVSAAH